MAAKLKPSDFDLANATPIGAGALSYVLRAEHLKSKRIVAVKTLSKVQLLQQGKVEAAVLEKDCLYELGPHPFIARLLGTGQSDDELYFFMEHLPRGDLLQHVRTVAAARAKGQPPRQNQGEGISDKAGSGENNEPSAAAAAPQDDAAAAASSASASSSLLPCLDFHDIQLILAQIVVALSHCIRKGFVLRDLKPENICFDAKGRCCFIDFDTVTRCKATPHNNHGTAVRDKSPAERQRQHSVSEIQSMRKQTMQFCGTAHYVSPEMVGECKWSYSSDLWALGVIAYQLLYGKYPFKGSNTFAVMKQLIHGIVPEKHFAVRVPLVDERTTKTSDSSSELTTPFDRLTSFIAALLKVNPVERLGVDPDTFLFEEQLLRSHPLFLGFPWEVLDAEVASYQFDPNSFFKKANAPSADAAAAATTDGKDQDAAVDSRSSLFLSYHDMPTHSEEYASYVCRMSNDVNPFEEWVHRELHGEGDQVEEKGEENTKTRASSSSEEEEESEKGDDSASSDEDDDVLDDVGMRYAQQRAPADFQQ